MVRSLLRSIATLNQGVFLCFWKEILLDLLYSHEWKPSMKGIDEFDCGQLAKMLKWTITGFSCFLSFYFSFCFKWKNKLPEVAFWVLSYQCCLRIRSVHDLIQLKSRRCVYVYKNWNHISGYWKFPLICVLCSKCCPFLTSASLWDSGAV